MIIDKNVFPKQLGANLDIYALSVTPPPNTSHQQEKYFSVGYPYKPSFATGTGWGVCAVDSKRLLFKHENMVIISSIFT